MTESLITRYRPDDFDQVLGQEPVVKALLGALDNKRAQTFLLTGPPGTGKTTLARLAAKRLGCTAHNLIEVDAATKTGIDDMRAVAEELVYRPLGGPVKVVLIDEAHGLSKNAWTSLLKVTEEPPDWVFWFLCTTEPTKVPDNVRRRCLRLDLKPVDRQGLTELLEVVAETEKLDFGKDSAKIIELCVREAGGSPGQALANLLTCSEAGTLAEAAKLMRSAEESSQAIDLARALNQGTSWEQVSPLLNNLADVNPESVRHIVRAYTTKVVLGAKSQNHAMRGLAILDAFKTPFHSSDGITPLVLACGNLLMGGGE